MYFIMDLYKLPQEIIRYIYEWDDTYKIYFNNCIQEINFSYTDIKIIMDSKIAYWNRYKLYDTSVTMYSYYYDTYTFYKLMLYRIKSKKTF